MQIQHSEDVAQKKALVEWKEKMKKDYAAISTELDVSCLHISKKEKEESNLIIFLFVDFSRRKSCWQWSERAAQPTRAK